MPSTSSIIAYLAASSSPLSASGDLISIDLVKDCYWLMTSGNNYLIDENTQLSTLSHGLYKSLNSNDSQYIELCGSGTLRYIGRLNSTNIDIDSAYIKVRASGTNISSTSLYINGYEIGEFDSWGGDRIETQTKEFFLNANQKNRVFHGRINSNYDYFDLRFVIPSSVSVPQRLYNIEFYYTGSGDWNNYTTTPVVETVSYPPSQISFRNNSNWVTNDSTSISTSGVSYLGNYSDSYYIQQNNLPDTSKPLFDLNATDYVLNGGLSLTFDTTSTSGVMPRTPVTRAQLNLKMSLPPSGTHENARDTFEVNGYNVWYKEKDHKANMTNAIETQQLKADKYGYFLYGAGEIVEQSGFRNYNVELNFLDPTLPSGEFSSTNNRVIDVINNTEFRFVGLPSGVQLSYAELVVQYVPTNFLDLYMCGWVYKDTVCTDIDYGTTRSSLFGNGGWQHRGKINESEIFDAFYDFSELTGHITYPKNTTNYYGQYVNSLPHDINDEITTIEPQRRNYYRNPIIVNLDSYTFDANMNPTTSSQTTDSTYYPTRYRNAVYNGSPFLSFDINDPDASLYSPDIAQIYFDDRIDLENNFTLYFLLYREPTNDGQSYGRIFQRGKYGQTGETNYEIICALETEKLKVNVKDSLGNPHQVDVDLPYYTIEPILVWITSYYNSTNDQTTITLNVHINSEGYFSSNWLNDSVTFSGGRKRYSDSKTILGSLYIPNTLSGQLDANSALSFVSFIEFAWANQYLPLDYLTSTTSVMEYYDISSTDSKKFLSSRICNSAYLNSGSGVLWEVINGSGLAEWNTRYSLTSLLSSETLHSIYNPIAIPATEQILYPSSIYVTLDLENYSNHPSGLYIDCDVEFDSPTTDNWKVSRNSFSSIPSGYYTGSAGISKHIGMHEGPILISEIDNLAVNVRTKYVDIQSQEYYGYVKLKDVNVCFDSFLNPQSTNSDLELYTFGGANTLYDTVDLYTYGFATVSSGIDLYIYGIPYYASGDITLYTNAEHYVMPDPGDLNSTKMPLFINGLTPISTSGDMQLFIYAPSSSGISGSIYKSIPLITSGIGRDTQLPLYIKGPTGVEYTSLNLYLEASADSITGDMDLYIVGPSGLDNVGLQNITLYTRGLGTTENAVPINTTMPLFIARDSESTANTMSLFLAQNNEPGNIDFYICGANVASSSIPLYINGSGILYNSLKLYSHGF